MKSFLGIFSLLLIFLATNEAHASSWSCRLLHMQPTDLKVELFKTASGQLVIKRDIGYYGYETRRWKAILMPTNAGSAQLAVQALRAPGVELVISTRLSKDFDGQAGYLAMFREPGLAAKSLSCHQR